MHDWFLAVFCKNIGTRHSVQWGTMLVMAAVLAL
jgi:hypothetical protein